MSFPEQYLEDLAIAAMEAMNASIASCDSTVKSGGPECQCAARMQDMLAALKRLHELIDFDESWVPCGCFDDPRDLEAALRNAKLAIDLADGKE